MTNPDDELKQIGERVKKESSLDELVRSLNAAKGNSSFGDSAFFADLCARFYLFDREDYLLDTFNLAKQRRMLSAGIYFLITDFYELKGELKSAISFGKEAIKENMFREDVLNVLANAHFNSGNTQEAIKTLELAIEKEMASPDTFMNLSMIYSKNNDEKAMTALELGVKKGQLSDELILQLSSKYFRLERIDDAIALIESAQKKIDVGPINLSNLAGFYEHKGNPRKAEFILKTLVDSGEADYLVYLNLGNSYLARGKKSDAISTWKKALAKGFGHASILYSLFMQDFSDCSHKHSTKKFQYFNMLRDRANKDNASLEELCFMARAVKFFEDYFPEKSIFTELLKPDEKFFSSEHYLKRMVKKMREGGTLLTDRKKLGATVYYVTELFNEFLKEGIIIKEGNALERDGMKFSPFAEEIRVLRMIEKVPFQYFFDSKNMPSYPSLLDHFEENGKFYYVMQREPGITLTSVITDSKKDDAQRELFERKRDDVLRTLATLYVFMPFENEKDYGLRKRIENKGCSPEVLDNLNPLIGIMEKSKDIGYYKDTWTDNWIVNQHCKIVIVDTENRGRAPFALDLASFLNCIPYGTFDERLHLVSTTIDYINEICEMSNKSERRITDRSQFMREYYAAVIYKSLSASLILRKEQPHLVASVAKAGIEMIDYIINHNLIEEGTPDRYLFLRNTLKDEMKK